MQALSGNFQGYRLSKILLSAFGSCLDSQRYMARADRLLYLSSLFLTPPTSKFFRTVLRIQNLKESKFKLNLPLYEQ